MDGREIETRAEGARELDKRRVGRLFATVDRADGGVRIRGDSRLNHCNKLCLRVARIRGSAHNNRIWRCGVNSTRTNSPREPFDRVRQFFESIWYLDRN